MHGYVFAWEVLWGNYLGSCVFSDCLWRLIAIIHLSPFRRAEESRIRCSYPYRGQAEQADNSDAGRPILMGRSGWPGGTWTHPTSAGIYLVKGFLSQNPISSLIIPLYLLGGRSVLWQGAECFIFSRCLMFYV